MRLAVGVTSIDMLALLAVVNASLIATPTELLHLIIYIPRVEALRTSTLGWGNATPTELPLLAGCLRCAVAIRRKKPVIFAWVAMMAGLKDIGVGLLHGNEPEGYAVVAILEAILGLGFSRA